MSDNMKAAVAACILFMPILFGIGWVADIFARAAVGTIMVSHDATPQEVARAIEPILPHMMLPLLGVWVVASALTLLLAYLDVGPRIPRIPPPPTHKCRSGDT